MEGAGYPKKILCNNKLLQVTYFLDKLNTLISCCIFVMRFLLQKNVFLLEVRKKFNFRKMKARDKKHTIYGTFRYGERGG